MRRLSLCVTFVLACAAGRADARAIRASNDPVRDEPPVTETERQHWAYLPLRSAAGSLDGFIDAKLREQGLHRSPPADAATLARRVTFDLTGLPPAPAEVAAFEKAFAQNSDAALEALTDRLLASPAYGEHWAQWWLDLARFAETDGFEHDKERPRLWRYRDWVIAALNRDLPFDAFVRQQIAGDLLPDGEAVATGFLFSGPDMPDLNQQDERRHMLLNEITGAVGSVFLGLTAGCAQCHDHAYDAISQADFYRLRAFFDNTVLTSRDKPLPPEARTIKETVPASVVFVRGDFRRPGPVVAPGFPRVLGDLGVAPADRAALAQWLASKDNALFLRATANRLWQQHFGRPLAGTPGDLGAQGPPPTHPELLDWLAAELPRQGWSLKRLHKVIILSVTYRQATAGPEMEESEVAHYAAMPRRRLTGEMLRDAMLSVAGQLNPKAGGPGVRLSLPAEVAGTLLKKHTEAEASSADEQRRRSIYAFARRNARLPVFDLFDRPDALMSCARRETSTTAPQALLMMNSEFARATAAALAERALHETSGDTTQTLPLLFRLCYARPPSHEELAAAARFFEQASTAEQTPRAALADFCLALLNANEFVWVD